MAQMSGDESDSESANSRLSLSQEVRLFTPKFSTPTIIRQIRKGYQPSRSPVLPGIVYPFQLERYNFPCDIGTYIFWQNYKANETELDCSKLGIHNGQDLLELCAAPDAANLIASLVSPSD